MPRQEAPSLISYKCFSEGGGLSVCRVRGKRGSLTPCRPSAGWHRSGKDLKKLPMSELGTISTRVQTGDKKAQRRSETWPRSHSMLSLEGGLQEPQPSKSFLHSPCSPDHDLVQSALTRAQCPSVQWESLGWDWMGMGARCLLGTLPHPRSLWDELIMCR